MERIINPVRERWVDLLKRPRMENADLQKICKAIFAVYEAVAMAGGMTEDAGMEAVNQAEFVTDGQMLRIPTMEEVAAAQEESESNVDDGLLDINRASVADFMTLPGIGQSKAEALFQYREAHGRFSSIEEIMNVDGIKEGVFNKIKDSIKV